MITATAIAGCGDSSDTIDDKASLPTASAAPTAVADPAKKLTAAAEKTAATSYQFRAQDPAGAGTIEGSADPKTSSSTATMSVDLDAANKLTFQSIATGGAFFLKITGLPTTGGTDLAKYWLKADPAKITGSLSFLEAKDPIDVQGVVAHATNLKSDDGTLFTGTIDLSTAGSGGLLYDAAAAKELGDKAKAVPFSASVNPEGYVSGLKVSVPAYGTEPASEGSVTLMSFGTPVTVTAPTADVMPMPEQMYAVLNEQ
ncbi:hypothetical protein Dvina_23210 [Dactylosporangium vinaceum]|uniref:Lipoprotein n=1 Tax=Dactylosporangium vinaceum TaxID=53362 RepID=A0ABV5MCQ0_9ACTN|nr:hypothetical protein [Dactylosporangium vinaceum]UAC00702.1 hypothetical protein Dvina_23210 [Dactylosporangium vinaceum]